MKLTITTAALAGLAVPALAVPTVGGLIAYLLTGGISSRRR
tara:strand:+ start:492 stop:614 length:123 start_codon:yes stop_codon:yes gene_type:complete